MIKCPECKHSVSALASNCTHCGVKVESNIMKCPSCGELLIIGYSICPHCHFSLQHTPQIPINSPHIATPPPRKRRHPIWLYALLGSSIAVGLFCYYGYPIVYRKWQARVAFSNLQGSRDVEAYRFFLANYSDHQGVGQVREHLQAIESEDRAWQLVALTDQSSLLTSFIEQHPNSIYCACARQKIDSLAWEQASFANTLTSIDHYQRDFPKGYYRGEAFIRRGILAGAVSDANEKWLVREAIVAHLVAVRKQDKETISTQLSSELKSYYGYTGAVSDVIKQHLDALFAEGVISVRFIPSSNFQVEYARTAKDERRIRVVGLVNKQTVHEEQRYTEQTYRLSALLDGEKRICDIQLVLSHEN